MLVFVSFFFKLKCFILAHLFLFIFTIIVFIFLALVDSRADNNKRITCENLYVTGSAERTGKALHPYSVIGTVRRLQRVQLNIKHHPCVQTLIG